MYGYRVMIHPNNKQSTIIRKTMNKCIECNNIVYDYLLGFIKSKQHLPECKDVRKWFTIQKKIKDEETLNKRIGLSKEEIRKNHLDVLFYDVSNDALKQTIKDLYNSFVRYFKKEAKFPVKKDYKDTYKSYYVDPYKIRFTDNKVKLEKIANNKKENRQILNYVSLAEKNRIPVNCKYQNPRVIYYKNAFYISVSVEDEYAPKKKTLSLSNEVIGIDVNVSEIVTSDNTRYKSVTKDIRYKANLKRLKRNSRKLSRKYESAKKLKKELRNSKNYIKQRIKKNKYITRKVNLTESHDVFIVEDLICKRPKMICVEDLDIKSMQQENKKENKYIRRGIQNNGWRKLLSRIENKCLRNNIKLYKIDRWYPSSKKCHQCGTIKKDLLLSDRTYVCPNCKLKINRDLNAAINIRNYILSK